MILRRIELRSFRQFVEADVDFDLGTTIILGDNGSGKTTLLEAVKYALYGDCRGKIDSLPNMHHGGKTTVAVEFDLGDKRYRCERSKADARLLMANGSDWDVIAFSLNGVKDHCTKLIGLTCEQFSNSYFTEQKQIEFLKFKVANRQQEEISQMLGIELLASACKTAKERTKASAFALQEMQTILESKDQLLRDLAEKEAAVVQRSLEREAATAAVVDARGKLEKLRPIYGKAEEVVAIAGRIRNREDVGRQLKAELDNLKKDLDSAIAESAERCALDDVAKQYEATNAKHAEMTKLLGKFGEREKLQFSLDQSSKEIEVLTKLIKPDAEAILAKATDAHEKAVSDRGKRGNELQQALTAWHEEQRKNTSEIESIRNDTARLTAELQEVEVAEAKGICPTCGQLLPDGHAPRSEDLRKQIAGLEIRLAKATSDQDALRKEPAVVVNAIAAEKESVVAVETAHAAMFAAKNEADKQRDVNTKIAELRAAAAEIGKKLADSPTSFDRAAYDAQGEQLAELLPRFQRWLALANAPEAEKRSRTRFTEKQAQFEQEKASQAADKARMSELGLDEAMAIDVRREFTQAESAIPHLEERVVSCDKALILANGAVNGCKERLEKWEESAAKIEEHRHSRDLYKEVGDAMSELRTQLNSEIRPTLAAFAAETLMQITDGRYSSVDIDESFRATLYDGDNKKAVISGGEEDVLALALRIALSRYVQEKSGLPLSMLILDEVFGSLDADRKQNVLQMFNGLKSIFPQIILISHVENLTEHVDRILHVRYYPTERLSKVEEFTPEPALL